MAVIELRANAQPAQQRPPSRALQLRLPFEGNEISFLAMDTLHGTAFEHVLVDLRPRVVLDLRYSPRFDITGTSSVRVYSLFQHLGAAYQRFPVPFHLIEGQFLKHDLPAICQGIIRSYMESGGRIEAPLLVLLHTESHARLLSQFFCTAMTANTRVNWRIWSA